MSNTAKNNQVNVIDILMYLLRYWYLFVIVIAIAVGYTYYKYTQMPFVYRGDVTVVIKDPKGELTVSGLGKYSDLVNSVNMTHEIL